MTLGDESEVFQKMRSKAIRFLVGGENKIFDALTNPAQIRN